MLLYLQNPWETEGFVFYISKYQFIQPKVLFKRRSGGFSKKNDIYLNLLNILNFFFNTFVVFKNGGIVKY